MSETALPADLEAERALLAACLLDPAAIETARVHVQPPHLYRAHHALTYQAILALADARIPADPVTVPPEMARLGMPETDARLLVSQLLDSATTSANVEHHARQVREAAARRLIVETARTIATSARDRSSPPADLLARLRSLTDAVEPSLNGPTQPPAPLPGPEFARADWGQPSSLLGAELWCEGELAMLHAATGLGKTYLTEQLAHALATASPWLGLHTTSTPTPVLVMQAEVAPVRLAQRRAHRWPSGCPLVHTLTTHQLGRPLDLMQPTDRLLIIRAIRACDARVLILDPLRRYHTLGETPEGYARLIPAIEAIMLETGVATMLVHHEPKTSTDQHPRSDLDAARGATQLTDACKMVMRLKVLPSRSHVIAWSKCSFGEAPPEVYIRRDEHGWWDQTDPPVPVADRTEEAVERCLATAGDSGRSYAELIEFCAKFPGAARTRENIGRALDRIASRNGLPDRQAMNIGNATRNARFAMPCIRNEGFAMTQETVDWSEHGPI